MSVEPRSGRKWVIGFVVGLVVLVVAAFVLASPYSRKPVDDYIAAVKAAGRPVTLREALGPDPPSETNGVADVEAAGKWMDEHKGDPGTWKVVGPWSDVTSHHWGDAVTDEKRREFDAFLADSKPFFDGVAAGLAKPRLRGATPGDGGNFDVEDVEARVRVMKILAARAVVASKPDDRLDAVELLAKLAVRTECRMMIDEFVSSAAMDYATVAVRLALERGDVDPAAWRARLDGLFREPWLPRFREAARLERACVLERLRTADLNGSLKVSTPPDAERPLKAAWERIVARLDAIRRAKTTPDMSPAAIARALAASERFENAATDSYPRLVADVESAAGPPQRGSANWMIFSALVRTAQSMAKTDASCRLARIALAAAERRAKTGELPASLDELKDAFPDGVPLDPFTDAPFVYEKTAGGARLASVGRLPDDTIFDPRYPPDDGFVWVLKR